MSQTRRRSLTNIQLVKLYFVTLAAGVALDVVWLSVLSKSFYARQLGQLMRPDVQWVPAIAFYLLYAGAMDVFVVLPALRRRSFRWAVVRGAFFGVAAYSCFDLVSLALLKDFPVTLGLVDLAWGGVLSATACGVAYLFANRSLTD
jgi:uncharacterized membrane protein